MPKLHELLAVERDRNAVADKMIAEAEKGFEAGTHYHGHVKTWIYSDAEMALRNRTEEKKVDETVPGKLAWLGKHVGKMLDLRYQIDLANCEARADLVVKGKVVATAVPVSYLLMLETRLGRLRAVYAAIPTHKPGIAWVADATQSAAEDIYKSGQPQVETLTAKVVEHIVVVPPTTEHPAQVAVVNKDKPIGQTTLVQYTSTVSPADKAERLERLDDLIAAAKRARQRANDVKVRPDKVAGILLAWVNEGALPGTATSSPDDATEV